VIALLVLGVLPLVIWAGLLAAHGGFWLAGERDDRAQPSAPAAWPSVTAVVPARDEADVIARCVGSLLAQDYPGDFRVILVDDNSSDGTADIARAEAQRLGRIDRLTVISGQPLAAGWTGKLWAVSQGVAHAEADAPKYLWLTDADIGHTPDNLRALVSRAESGGLVLTSLMAQLHCRTLPERFLIPAFVFFFQMVYPFPKVNRPGRTAAAAGGCMLARRDALSDAGGIAAIRKALIDDCAMGALMKARGPIWLGLTHRAASLRPYQTVGEIGRMVSRSAYAQLDYSPIKLIGVVLGMLLVYIAPMAAILLYGPPVFLAFLVVWALAALVQQPILKFFRVPPFWGFAFWAVGISLGAVEAGPPVFALGFITWCLMGFAFQPMLRFYKASPLWGFALPAIGAAYTLFTVQSAVQMWRGKGGLWKGRAQAMT
jgi:hopene-associated glycosyltransferase HpnB